MLLHSQENAARKKMTERKKLRYVGIIIKITITYIKEKDRTEMIVRTRIQMTQSQTT